MSLPFSKNRRIYILLTLIICALTCSQAYAQRRRAPAVGQYAVIVDERLAALRDAPDLSARLLQRMSRGRAVAIMGAKRAPDGVTFYRVAVSSRTRGWLQSEAVVSPARAKDDERLLRLISASEGFDRLARARIFLDLFTRSRLRPMVLLLYGEAAEEAALKLSREAARRLDKREMTASGAPLFSYFMNYSGLDRYRRQGVVYTFDRTSQRFHYDGASWREIIRHHPRSPEAAEARKRLNALSLRLSFDKSSGKMSGEASAQMTAR